MTTLAAQFITDSKKEELNNALKASLNAILNPPADLTSINESLPDNQDPITQNSDVDDAISDLAADLTEKIDEYITERIRCEILGLQHWRHNLSAAGYNPPPFKTKSEYS